MRLADLPLTTLQGLGRRRLWWTRRPTRATSATSVATNATAVGGQASRPGVVVMAFQLPPLPTLALATRWAAWALVVGGLARFCSTVPARGVRGLPGTQVGEAPMGAPSSLRPAPRARLGAPGAWFGPDLRPLPVAGGGRGAPLRSAPGGGGAYSLPGGLPLLPRWGGERGRQGRLYAAAWAGTRGALLPPGLRGRGPVEGAAAATRGGEVGGAARRWGAGLAAPLGAPRALLPGGGSARWDARGDALYWIPTMGSTYSARPAWACPDFTPPVPLLRGQLRPQRALASQQSPHRWGLGSRPGGSSWRV